MGLPKPCENLERFLGGPMLQTN